MRGNVFSGNPIDRIGNRRKDAAFIAGARSSDRTRFLPMHGGRHLVLGADGNRIALLRAADAPALSASLDDRPWVLLGLLDEDPVIAIDLGDEGEPPALHPGAEFADLRSLAATLEPEDASLLAQARGLLNWRRAHRFCGVCGAACMPVEGGYVMRCTACGTSHFPRTDPAVIMLITSGDRVLLARNARFGERRLFSALAGFVEPGESLEEAVIREVAEECGVGVSKVRYHSSQPWPFPASIMLGFVAETADETITIDGDEIIEAAFFTRAQLRDHAAHGFGLPPRLSIARRMIDDWCEEG